MVLDRLFLWIFTLACLIGTALIIFQAPALYDKTKPIDIIYSKIAKKKLQAILWDTTTIQSSMTYFSKKLSEYKHLIDNNPIMYKIYFVLLIIKFLLYIVFSFFFIIDFSWTAAATRRVVALQPTTGGLLTTVLPCRGFVCYFIIIL